MKKHSRAMIWCADVKTIAIAHRQSQVNQPQKIPFERQFFNRLLSLCHISQPIFIRSQTQNTGFFRFQCAKIKWNFILSKKKKRLRKFTEKKRSWIFFVIYKAFWQCTSRSLASSCWLFPVNFLATVSLRISNLHYRVWGFTWMKHS